MTATVIIIDGIADELLLDMRWDTFAKTTLQVERRFKPVLRRLFTEQQDKVLQNIVKRPPPEPERAMKQGETQLINYWLLDPQEWYIVFENAAKPFIRQSMEEGYDEAIKDIEAITDVELGLYFDVQDQNVARMMDEKLREFSFRVNQTTNRALKKTLREGLENNENIRMISKRVANVFGQAKSYRTERIARTEIVGAHNAGGYRSKVDSGIVKSRKWVATRDARTRDAHRAMDGEVALLNRKYSNGLMYPGDWRGALDQFINCRCTEIVEEFTDDAVKVEQTAQDVREEVIRTGEARGKEIAALTKEADDLFEQSEKLRRQALSNAEVNKRWHEVTDRKKKLSDELAKDLRPLLQVSEDGFEVSIKYGQGESTKFIGNMNKNMREFSKMVDSDLVGSQEIGIMRTRKRRAFAEGRTITMTKISPDMRSVVHEAGHWLENINDDVLRKAEAFFERRTTGERAKWLGKPFNMLESGKRDKFIDPYMGKVYFGKRNTEITSMGLEYMYSQPYRLAKDDPDYFEFMYNLVRGR